MYYHLVAILPAGKQKTIPNKGKNEILPYVMSFETVGTITEKWGKASQTYQALEIRIYQTKEKWVRRSKVSFDEFIKKRKNCYSKFKKEADEKLGENKQRIFVIMPIQGKKSGTQNEQRIFQEYDRRYEAIADLMADYDCVAIRIDKEHPIDQLVDQIKKEIRNSLFVIADLTDERPSCYFEAGFAEGLKTPVIYIASEESILIPGQKTKIHFDIHMNVNFFSNNQELKELVKVTIKKNKDRLFIGNNLT